MSVTFSAPLMDAKHFPSSLIKAQPAFKLSTCRLRRNSMPMSDVSTFNKARYALAAAAFHLKDTEQQNTVLLPAYHCPALIEPFIYAGYKIIFYPQLADLSSDLKVFNSLLTPDITHVVVVRYFGFSQNAELLMNSAHSAGKKVIEDNAHSLPHFWRTCASKPVEVSASVSSIPKTLGAADGGVLYLPGYKANVQRPDIYVELKALLSGSRLTPISAKHSKDMRYFHVGMQAADCLRASRWLMLRSDYDAISRQRRENYQYLAKQLLHSAAGEVLYPTLGEHDVPYMMPFLLSDTKWFSKLRESQIQVLRWEELVTPATGIATDYQQQLVQLPVHQDLSKSQLASIVNVFQ